MTDTLLMRRALDLASLGRGAVAPNPLVGCVIARNNKIIGEGWHKNWGGPHAEANAMATVSDTSLLSEATVYVTLEPCAHQGKTPPCAELLIRSGVRRVVIANEDPNPIVAGRGVEQIKQAGIAVDRGLLRSLGRILNRRFFTFHEQRRPYIILKWAQTQDGFMANRDRTPQRISNALTERLLHKWRSEESAILVGSRTALSDNPKLSVREWIGPQPTRVIIDRKLMLPHSSLHLFDQSIPTLCYNEIRDEQRDNLSFVRLQPEKDTIQQVLTDLYGLNKQSLIVEGGPSLLSAFLDANLWDEARIFSSSFMMGDGICAPRLAGEPVAEQSLGDNKLRVYLHPRYREHWKSDDLSLFLL